MISRISAIFEFAFAFAFAIANIRATIPWVLGDRIVTDIPAAWVTCNRDRGVLLVKESTSILGAVTIGIIE